MWYQTRLLLCRAPGYYDAEWVNEDIRAREAIRNLFQKDAIISSILVKGKEEEVAKYRDYFDFSEPLRRCPSHRLLAIRRGEKEGLLRSMSLLIRTELSKYLTGYL